MPDNQLIMFLIHFLFKPESLNYVSEMTEQNLLFVDCIDRTHYHTSHEKDFIHIYHRTAEQPAAYGAVSFGKLRR